MSDNEIIVTKKSSIRISPYVIAAFVFILTLSPGMSNPVLGGAKTIPYDQGGTEDVPAAAARLLNIRCDPAAKGCAYTFDVEVFEASWKPVYAVAVYGPSASFVEPLSWPQNWKAGTIPSGATSASYVMFYTLDHPILPGLVQTGFGLMSYSGSATVRWFPADQDGILIGKVSRLDLSCPTANETRSWGSIKAKYR
jgi:hypothetical protein